MKSPRKVAAKRMLGPVTIDHNNWYYEERTHLLLVHEVRDKAGAYTRADTIKIPWRMIEASCKRRPK